MSDEPTPYTPHAIEKRNPDGLWYIAYPGHEAWAKIAPGDFVDVRNPTTTPLRALLNIGPDATLHVRLERTLIPVSEQLPQGVVRERLAGQKPLRRGFVRLEFTFPPGEVVRIPDVFWPALRTLDRRSGVIVSGAVPQLVLDGETNPPELHPALRVGEPEAPAPVGRRRRRDTGDTP
jgi:hypothetical protein